MKTEEVKLRISAEEKANWVIMAEGAGVSLSKYIRDVMNNVPTNGESVPTNVRTNVPTGGDIESIDDLLEIASRYDTEEEDYSEVVEAIRRVEGADFQADEEDIASVGRLIEEMGLSYNKGKGKLWKQEGEQWKLVYDFNK